MIKLISNKHTAFGDGGELLGKFRLHSQAVKAYADYKSDKLTNKELKESTNDG